MERVPALDLTALDPEQAAAVRAPRGPVCVLAGAGTGKTRTITYRIAHLVAAGQVKADQVLAVTFTARAAGELRGRLRALGLGGEANQVQARTFHAAALRQLRYFWPQVVGDVPWRLLDSKFPVVAQAAHRAGLPSGTESVRDLLSEIEWAKSSLIAPEDYPAAVARHHRDAPFDANRIAQVYTGYEALKTTPDGLLLDFDDLLLHTAAALEDYPAVADEFRGRYRCFVVDEYQDVTPLQQRVLDAWLGERDDLTVVGDANQTIYSFTGASPAHLLDFSRRFPDATVVRLERDYRSTPQVVSLANRVIGMARGRIAGTRLQLIGQRADGPEPTFAEYDDVPAEAAGVARAIAELIAAGTPAAEIAVLYRINAQSETYEQALTERGIPYQVRGGEGFFTRAEVRQAVQALRQAAARDDLPDQARTGDALVTLVRAVLAPLGLTATEPTGAQAREKWSSLVALVQLTEELTTHDERLDLPGLLRELAARAEARHPPTVQGVTLASLHAAKGLEWDATFLVGLSDGTLPIAHVLADDGSVADQAALEEERRLLYVGVTRAREHLQLSWALARNAGGRRTRRRSRFLNGLVPDDSPASRIAAPSTDRSADGTRPLCRVCAKPLIGTYSTMLGRCRRCPAELDVELLAALHEWRAEKAQDQRLKEFSVFTDTTLTAIAEQLPTDDAALAAISGIGPRKIEQYGADVIALVRSRTATNHKTAGRK
ncbi:ATP-dependent DNA helicase UvrD2 [Nocardia cyriacigeorgica]|uniref:ATP-dependent DNA helicase UvrD2 n=1 Tax=Nocardia cyriacigeorgica TaxID=135487 RepID=A0A6P1D1C2_9NOCA|nr:ATP-dependent DNA helicase UvrD2 [Nocardia cyriacigeorgica]NEW41040.1 ATP-dependent DNA helicase UvrD2 [Nocardia cyriacigeorgica]NEW44306.1 ATP-dependent DNA helicase UvrD2 [Nocardia cyriacigeorgica]NEW52924.1 ATP-dependent DNA helicase UvrD2 [Nocardia cyriacigeorgica]NEW55226.1 ATP-dependent DNA helicase UvrD2 [Nocardia cyriacigeorgica]